MRLKGTIATLLITTTLLSFQTTFAVNPEPQDTTFKKNNPKYFYTIRDYYVDVPTSCIGKLCLKDVYLVFTFNIAMNGSQEVKQIGFKEADLEFQSKKLADKTFVKQTFTKYESISSQNGWAVKVTFFPDKTNSSLPPSVIRCEFDGTVTANNVSGNLIFYSTQGELSRIVIN